MTWGDVDWETDPFEDLDCEPMTFKAADQIDVCAMFEDEVDQAMDPGLGLSQPPDRVRVTGVTLFLARDERVRRQRARARTQASVDFWFVRQQPVRDRTVSRLSGSITTIWTARSRTDSHGPS